LICHGSAKKAVGGQPIGNGEMGMLVRTT